MKYDFHIHSGFSGDSDTPMEDMIRKGISLGLKTMCMTEHYDEDFPAGFGDFSLDTEAYYGEFCRLKAKYAGDIELLFGVELGMQVHLGSVYEEYVSRRPFDYCIASQHLSDRIDPYYPLYWEKYSPQEGICRYFSETLECLKNMKDYDALGHLDYIVRYSGPGKDSFHYAAYADHIDPILQHIIEEGKCLEVNTAGLKYGLGHPNPREDILKRYREMGGEDIIIGSDGHRPEHLAYGFDLITDLLKDLGFRYHCIFRERKAVHIPL